jgi:hypothetical protein
LPDQKGVLPQAHNQQVRMIFLRILDDSFNFVPIDELGIEQEACGLRFWSSDRLTQYMFCRRAFNPLVSWQRRNIPRKD